MADTKLGEIHKGMNSSEVLVAYGSPQEKIDFESKRETVWIYPDKEIILSEGKVKAWRIKEADGSLSDDLSIREIETSPIPESEENESVVEEILDELLKQTSPSKGR
ncbi:MAG: hypothetical protein R3A13_08820 [Bdellovibrionota bacterium]